MKPYFQIINHQQGTVLLLALLVMAGVVAAGAGVGTLVISELRQSRQLDQAIVAYYLAESGIEDALFQLRKGDIKEWPNKEQIVNQGTVNEGKWKRTAENPAQISASLAEEDVLEIRTNGQPRKLTIDWQKDDKEKSQLHIIKVLFIEGKEKVVQDLWGNSPVPLEVDEQVQLVRLRAIFGPISKITVKAGVDGVPGFWEITSTGQYRESRQAVTIVVPEKEPAYSLFDYAIFSGSDLSK